MSVKMKKTEISMSAPPFPAIHLLTCYTYFFFDILWFSLHFFKCFLVNISFSRIMCDVVDMKMALQV